MAGRTGESGTAGRSSRGLSRRGFLTATAVTPVLAAGAGTALGSTVEEGSGAALARQGGPVRTGADQLAARAWAPLAGRRLGVLSNPTAVLADLEHVVDSMHAAEGVDVVAAFGPEHGFRGTSQAGGSEGDYVDPRTGIPVYDAYGVDAGALAAMYRKAGVDTVVFDIADVGARFYTYIWSMYTAMHAAALAGVSFVVLDRPNPIGGRADGPQLDPAFASGVGRKPVVLRHGMTAGELAGLFDAEFLPEDAGSGVPSLEVVRLEGWDRGQVFVDTGLPWVPPSPNMPTPDTATLYPGTCLFEGTVLSEGRGTTRPFETVGAPGLDWRWAGWLNDRGLPGVRFRETYFVPTFGKHEGVQCGGVTAHVTDPAAVDPIEVGVSMLVSARQLYPDEWGWRPDHFIDKLAGSATLRTMVDAGAPVEEITGSWAAELAEFEERRAPHLTYPGR
ncbi:DUF1343 domain-containing protein [Actinoalloteichus sp. AHMU CJ021]|uniref:Uncharacterized conserved protein YbbC, DUF1343 family n=1 Tax=Actinoalloteichus caeruleus DSM 43889 TaxID=1120930 RepID=A0ABT1JJM3_ACTCY|nr:DUF1343 domain-containing protein [Actinoalloteichus caeruleus]AUS78590.1 DUF1343 domain-containing protein [Actinoalloteichus sp. AHMU CJ021]MCP2332715.1 Uncharacterized conserved protein YbbC, DUF1343 family [Actinoalloteichus caeruleus DSM 43889]